MLTELLIEIALELIDVLGQTIGLAFDTLSNRR